MSIIRLNEIDSGTWNIQLLDTAIDRSEKTVADLCTERGIEWTETRFGCGDVNLFKAMVRESSPFLDPLLGFFHWVSRAVTGNSLLLIGEPRHRAASYYRTANPEATLACAPAKNLKRLVLAQAWKEPHLEDWDSRLDKFVWFGLPYPERVALAKEIVSWGVELDVYSREPWPIPGYKGPAQDEYTIARKYKYRLAVENSNEYLYHSEKLFQSQRAGCMTFFRGDPDIDLHHAEGSFLHLSRDAVDRREFLAPSTLAEQKKFIFGTGWEYYSYRRMVTDILDLVEHISKRGRAK